MAVPVLIGVIAMVLYGLLGWQQWRNLVAPSWDLGIFTQLAKAYGELRAPIVPIKGDGANLLGDHFHPILVLLAPVWWIWPSGLALLWTQAALFGLSAVPIARCAMERLGSWPGLVVGVAYALSFGLQSAAAVQFHEIAFAVPMLAFSLVALVEGRVAAAVLWAAPLVLVKEDLGLTVAMLGGVIALWHRPYRREGIGLACWGVGWFVLSTFVILPLLNTGGQYDYTDNLADPTSLLWPPVKWATAAMLVMAAGVIGARSPLILLMLPTLAWRFAGSVEFYWDWYWHYNAVLMPIAATALLDVLGDRRTDRVASWWTRLVAIAAMVAVTLVPLARIPLLDLARPQKWDLTWRAAPAERALEAVPDGAVLATEITLLAKAVPDHDVQWLHGGNTRVPDCAIIDRYAFSWGGQPPEDPAQWAADQWQVPVRVVVDDGGFTTVCRAD